MQNNYFIDTDANTFLVPKLYAEVHDFHEKVLSIKYWYHEKLKDDDTVQYCEMIYIQYLFREPQSDFRKLYMTCWSLTCYDTILIRNSH